MKLRTRLSVILGATLVASGVLIGGATAWLSRSDAVQRIDNSLGVLTARINVAPANDVEILLASAETSPFPLIGEIFYDNADPFSVVEGLEGDIVDVFPTLSMATVQRAVEHPITISGSSSLRIRATESGAGQWIVVGTSLRTVDVQFQQSLLQSLLVSTTIALLTVLIVWFVLRRELRPIIHVTESATAIAAGNLGVVLPISTRTNEVGELTAALRAMTNKLQDALAITSLSEQKMREFLGDASHELRTPLTVVRGYVDILFSGRELSIEQRERAISRLVSESKRMDVIINDLLLLAELGEVRIANDDEVDLSRLVNDHFSDLRMQQPDRNVTINVAPALMIMGSATHLERLVTNIKSNIVLHTSPSASVEIYLTKLNDNIVLEVNDAGPGLAPSMYARSTAEFQRFDHARSPDGGGFGLGLSIIASIVHHLGGTLELSPSPLGGLQTRVVVPA